MQWLLPVYINFQHMKKYFFILLLIPVVSMAQKKHTVGPKESLFSLARQYNVHPRELAEFNHIPFEKGLTIGQVIKIPSKTTMAPLPKASDVKVVESNGIVLSKDSSQVIATVPKKEQNSQHVSTDLSPIFHTVQKKETLYQISQKYNKVPIADIKSWNHLKEDGVKEGMKLIVGYASKPSVKEQVSTLDSVKSVTKNIPATNVTVAVPPKKIEPAPAESKNIVVKNTSVGGFFASASSLPTEANAINETGLAGVFKSTSGWDDKKFYCLYNNATAGTIVKITNTDNQKFIYAKVLDMMPDLKQNKDFIIRISNAAAQELGASSDSFKVLIQR